MGTWYNRVKGTLVKELPALISNGKFSTNMECVFNTHSMLSVGQMIVNDGTGKFHLNDEVYDFFNDEKPVVDTTELDIIENALFAYQDVVEEGGRASFLIPEKLLARFELSNLEKLLSDVLNKGHLQEIARRPRMELIYDEHLIPVSRAKKLAPNASRHLASHSECWQTRTFTGVVPRSILALESEDQLNIYENRVYVKLLSHIENHLVQRIAGIRKLEELFENATSFQNAENIYYEVRDSVFTLWGEGFSHESYADEATTHSKTTLSFLVGMLKKVRVLQHTKLYRKLHQNLHVPLKINMTNVLSHDQHYCHVARLWHQWLETQQTSKLDPKHIYEKNLAIVDSYTQYCFDLTKRALKELGFSCQIDKELVHVNGNRLSIEMTSFSEIVVRYCQQELVLVPWFSSEHQLKELEGSEQSNRVLIGIDASADQSLGYVCLSPIYFYSLESITALISKWLALHTFSGVGAQLRTLPANFLKELSQLHNGHWTINSHQLTINGPCGKKITDIENIAKSYRNDISIQKAAEKLICTLSETEYKLYCPVCSTKSLESSWKQRDDQCFIVHNSNCKHEWMLNRQQNGDRLLVVRPKKYDKSVEFAFEAYGRFFWEINMV